VDDGAANIGIQPSSVAALAAFGNSDGDANAAMDHGQHSALRLDRTTPTPSANGP
jgi:hypothetical protein